MTTDGQHMSGVPCLAFPLHDHCYSKDLGTIEQDGVNVRMWKCVEPFCNATKYENMSPSTRLLVEGD